MLCIKKFKYVVIAIENNMYLIKGKNRKKAYLWGLGLGASDLESRVTIRL